MAAPRPFPASLALWRDRAGAFSPVRAVALALAVAPAAPLIWRIFIGDLGARPLTEISHVTGLWAIRLLAATLAVTPLVALARAPRLAAARRILGVSVFVWMMVHFAAFVADKSFDPVFVAREIALRVYLTIGMAALLMLAALAATSTDGMVSRLGAARWKRLHLLVYPIAMLGLAHFFLQAKSDISEPIAMTGVFALLFVLRIPKRVGAALSAPLVLALSGVVALATAFGEALWYFWKAGAPIALTLESNLDVELGVRPCWWALAVGIALAGASLLARTQKSARRATSTQARSRA